MFEEIVELTATAQKLEKYWSPQVVAQVNDQFIKVAKLRGSLVRHRYEDEDELFLVLRGKLTIRYEGGRAFHLKPGSIHVVPRGVLHNLIAKNDCWIALIETATPKYAGEIRTPFTKTIEQHLT